MLLYIIKSSTILLALLIFYKLFLEKENMHVFKRFYLMASLIAAFGIPFITFTSYVFISPIEEFSQLSVRDSFIGILVEENKTDYLAVTIWTIYGLGVLFFGSLFIKNLGQLLTKIKRNTKIKNKQITNVLLLHSVIPHTFFKYIFLNKSDFENQQIPQEVLLHEETHALQKHSIDVLFIEFLQIVFWFNPFIYLIKHAIKLNHEFLADQAVLNQGIETSNYQKTLLNFSSGTNQPQLANAINYSFIKKRFTIMKTHTSKKAIWLRSLIVLPLLALLIYGFSEKVIIQQEKATPEQITEYNKLAKYYNTFAKDKMIVKLQDVERIRYIYDLMTLAQREKATSFPNFPPPPPVPSPKRVYIGQKSNDIPPPPPPLPPIPSEHMKELAKKGAIFFYEGKKITPIKAQKIAENNKSINIQVLDHNSSKPIVKLSKKPITIQKD